MRTKKKVKQVKQINTENSSHSSYYCITGIWVYVLYNKKLSDKLNSSNKFNSLTFPQLL